MPSGDVDIGIYQDPSVVRNFNEIAKRFNTGKPVSPELLASFTGNFINFMERYGGINSMRPCPFTRLPAEIFRDYSVDGPLYFLLETVHRSRSYNSWKNIDLFKKNKFDSWCKMIRHINMELKRKHFIKERRTAISSHIKDDEICNLKRIIEQHGAVYVKEENDPTHVIITNQHLKVSDEDYVRTLKIDGEKKVAFIHWWYTPSSYDEWISLDRVQGDSEPEQVHKGPWRVQKRFLYDCEKYNEWGVEKDYEWWIDGSDGSSDSEKNINMKLKEKIAEKHQFGEDFPKLRKRKFTLSNCGAVEFLPGKKVRKNKKKKYKRQSPQDVSEISSSKSVSRKPSLSGRLDIQKESFLKEHKPSEISFLAPCKVSDSVAMPRKSVRQNFTGDDSINLQKLSQKGNPPSYHDSLIEFLHEQIRESQKREEDLIKQNELLLKHNGKLVVALANQNERVESGEKIHQMTTNTYKIRRSCLTKRKN